MRQSNQSSSSDDEKPIPVFETDLGQKPEAIDPGT
jgi:hypothetical protein